MATPPPPADAPADIFVENPYAAHPSLSPLERDVLWEYAKLAEHLKQLKHKTRALSAQPDALLLARLRAVENKMGLILTLFKASVWGVINEQHVAERSRSPDFARGRERGGSFGG
ncbi:DASH complex subunit Dad3-domain-containing protein [Mycena belliarum]|uniref:DASH complex subunit DAD3 n=1 Tax=Mycena belliarum TaxID=1033014 RepID=A0AAD6U4N2_9AGAR|nr:DASH complex subunit Dad3-domain-containing protein [Mycena belliae]